MPTVKEILERIGDLAGLKENQEFALAISASSLSDISIPDDLSNKILNSVLTEETAKANIGLKNYFIGQFAQGLDQDVYETAKRVGLSGEELAAITGEKSTGQKFKLYQKGVERLMLEAQKKGNSEEFVRKVQEAENRVQQVEAQLKAEIDATRSKYLSKLEQQSLAAQLSGIQWNDALTEAIRVPAFNAAIQTELQAMGAKLLFDDETASFKVVNANDPTLPVMVQNKEFGFADLKSQTLQKHKLLKEVGSGGGNPSPIPQGTPNPGNPSPSTKPLTGQAAQVRGENAAAFAALLPQLNAS